jgi:aspartate racemase
MSRHIGIVGCSAEGAALCYRTVCMEASARMGRHAHPEVSMHTHSLADYVRHIDTDDWPAVAALMLSSALKLEAAGADFLICPDNTIHQAMAFVVPASRLPWLHIAEVVAQEAAARGFRQLGITGTRSLVESDVYPGKLSERGVDWTRPRVEDRAEINRIIMEELVCGIFLPEAVTFFQDAIGRLAQAGCDGVVLGCTEIPLIMNDRNSPLPTLDSTRLLARAALDRAVGATD